VPDLWELVDLHIDEIDRLFEATGAEWFERQPAPAMRPRRAEEEPGQEEPGQEEPGQADREEDRQEAGDEDDLGGLSAARISSGASQRQEWRHGFRSAAR
jgi:hypothetical protein